MKSAPHSFADLFVLQLRRLYGVELEEVALLPHMAEASASLELKEAFQSHLEETRNQVTRLEEIFGQLGTEAGFEACLVMRGLVQACHSIVDSIDEPPSVRDAALCAAAQCIEHYEIAEYGTCRTYAQELGFFQVADLLQQTLDEEAAADNQLTLLAEGSLFHSGINARAHEVGV